MELPGGRLLFLLWSIALFAASSANRAVGIRFPDRIPELTPTSQHPLRTAVFALGSFWRSEAVFGCLPGVVRTSVGYAAGSKTNPEYRNLGDHAECVRVDVGSKGEISCRVDAHDNRELAGAPGGGMYQGAKFSAELWHLKRLLGCFCRSIIFTNRTQEARLAAVSKEREQAKSRSSLVTTEIQQLGVFYPAEAEHQVFLSFLNDIGGQIAVRAIWSSPSAFIWNALLTLPYLVQKFELKRNRFLLQLIGNMPDEELTTSSLAAKLNGYAAELCPTIIQRKIDAKIDEIVKNGWPVLREI
ncbi:hypothetical protein BHE74_00037784 [Ensete ventricosum]|nr:hypothetical protein BHE74_00037784 [Ensete ventricosum]